MRGTTLVQRQAFATLGNRAFLVSATTETGRAQQFFSDVFEPVVASLVIKP
jgi:hypothetical protein